ncbi:MAG: hypothetical protein CW338_00170 [Clostridiales bacterium]|nr:hypothetical protein [Clostridiales bacterium]
MKRARNAAGIILLLIILSFAATAPSAAEGLPVYFQRDSFVKPDSPVEWVDESPFAGTEEDELLQIDYLGIRQGDCIIITFRGKRMLVDGGENFRYAAVEKYLQSKRIDRFDCFLLTHAHADHIGLPVRMLNHGYIPQIQYSPYEEDDRYGEWSSYAKQLKEAGTELVRLQTGDTVSFGDDVTLKVFRWDAGGSISINDHSMVVMVQFGDARMLLTADVTGKAQKWLMQNFAPEEFKCDIMKAPHHGNNFLQAELADAASPSLVIITNPKSYTKDLNGQLDRRHIPHIDISVTVHCQTDGKVWYIWREKMPE